MNLAVNFNVRPAKANKAGFCPLEVSLRSKTERSIISLSPKVKPEQWNQELQCVDGDSIETKEINEYISVTRSKLYSIQSKLILQEKPFDLKLIIDIFKGKVVDKSKWLVKHFREYNAEYETLVGKTITKSTYMKHETSLKHLQQYLKEKYGRDDILMSEMNKSFLDGLYNFIRVDLKISNNTAVGYIKKLKKVVTIAFNDGVISSNPFGTFKMQLETKDVTFLSLDEIKTIYNKEISIKRLEEVRDIYIFACFTGLAFIDVMTFEADKHLKQSTDGSLIIQKKRQKTGVMCTIPLLDIPKQILEKYDYELPQLSNQKMNAYLKEVQTICGIEKNIHFHQARHSFCTSVTLNNNIPLTSVAKMVGHTTTKHTQHYAKVLESTLSNEMNILNSKIVI